MRILVVNNVSDRVETALYKGLAAAGMEVHAVYESAATGEAQLSDSGIAITGFPIRHRLDFVAVRRLRALIESTRPDLIYAPRNSTLSVSLLATRSSGIPVVGYRGTIGHISKWDPACWLTYLHPRVAAIVCVSNAVREYLLTFRLPPERLETVYKGHDLAWYADAQAPDISSFGVPADAFVVGFIGNIRAVKGVDHLIRAVTGLDERLNAHLLLIGEVRDKKLYDLPMQTAGGHRVIHFAGFQQNAARFARAFDTLVVPSVAREGLPRAMMEAMAQGLPVIVTKVGGMPEVVENDVSGIVVPPADAEALGSAVVRLAGDAELRKRLGQAARVRIEEDFNIQSTIDGFLQLFKRVCSEA